MSELRQDRTTGTWVVIAPKRGQRPRERPADLAFPTDLQPYDAACPFCPGNENRLTTVIEEVAMPEPPGWRLRVVANKYPAFEPDGAADTVGGEYHRAVFGYHEVIVETARHDGDLATFDGPGLEAVIDAYHRRFSELIARPGIRSVVVFRNHGRGAGASIAHPHSQVIATSVMAPRLAAVRDWALKYHSRSGHCAMCEEIKAEIDNESRVTEITKAFIALVPFAATSPFEQWIVPRRHAASFAGTSKAELAELGGHVQRALRRLAGALGDTPYRLSIESDADDGAGFLHWRVRIVPNLVTPGGFELATDLPINPSLPEQDAAALRGVSV